MTLDPPSQRKQLGVITRVTRHSRNSSYRFLIDHYNRVHPHRALSYRSSREFIDRSTREDPSGL